MEIFRVADRISFKDALEGATVGPGTVPLDIINPIFGCLVRTKEMWWLGITAQMFSTGMI